MTHIFIVNPYAGNKTFANDLRKKLEEIPNLHYFIFSTRSEGDEITLVKRVLHIFENEKLRFYSCGGSGTMKNILNGLHEAGVIDHTEVAFYPCGLTNDFLKVFSELDSRFEDIQELVQGDVISVDYIKTQHSIALNTVSLGFDSNVLKKLDDYRSLRLIASNLPYTLALIYSIFLTKTNQYVLTLDDTTVDCHIQELCIGNGHVLGGNLCFTENANPTDGIGSYCYVKKSSLAITLSVLRSMQTSNFSKLATMANLGSCHSFRVRRKDKSLFNYNCDGDLVRDVSEIEGIFVKKGLSLVVPKGVSL